MSYGKPLEPDMVFQEQYMLVAELSDGVTGPVWKAEDTSRGGLVSIKMLAGDVAVNRSALAEMARARQGLRHAAIAPVLEVNEAAKPPCIVREFAEGESLPVIQEGRAMDRNRYFQVAMQVAKALAFSHRRGLFHGNLRPDNVILNRKSGMVKLVGLGLVKSGLSKQQAGTPQNFGHLSIREVSSLSPEQIKGEPPDSRSDIFSFGTVFYHLVTGRAPFAGNTSLDVVNGIATGQCPSPAVINPSVNKVVVGIIGRCLQKDPARRYSSMEELLVELRKESGINADEGDAGDIADEELQREAAILVAEIHDYESISSSDPDRASRLSNDMQQLLWNSIYDNSGIIVDPLAARIVAEFPDAARATEAARAGAAEIEKTSRAAKRAGTDLLEIHIVVHAGIVVEREASIGGPAVDVAAGALGSVPASQIFVSERVCSEAGMKTDGRPATIFSGVKFYRLQPKSIAQAASDQLGKSVGEPSPVVAVKAPEKRSGSRIAVAAAVAAVVLGAGVVAFGRWGRSEPVAAAAAPAPARERISRIHIPPFTGDGSEQAESIRLGVIGLLRFAPRVEVVEQPGKGVVELVASVRQGASGQELVPTVGTSSGAMIPTSDAGAAVVALARWAMEQLGVDSKDVIPEDAAVAGDMAAALAAGQTGTPGDNQKAARSIRAALERSPDFIPALSLAVGIFESTGDRKSARTAAEKLIVRDPGRLDVARKLLEWQTSAGDVDAAITTCNSILQREPGDPAALTTIGHYALASADESRFGRVLKRNPQLSIHAPDSVLAKGKFDAAATKFYDLRASNPDDPALSLKIGRIAVLRRSVEIAQLELDRLSKLDPEYGYHLLKAYMEAQNGRESSAESELKIAAQNASWGDGLQTRTAEIYAILGKSARVVDALEKASSRHEPSMSYVLNNPLFAYLFDDPKLARLKQDLISQRDSIRKALEQSKV